MPDPEPNPSSLTEAEWKLIQPLVPGPKLFGRPPRYSKRAILDAIFYVVRGGIAWRLLPHDLPPWRIVYDYFCGVAQTSWSGGARGSGRPSTTPCATGCGGRAEKKAPTAGLLRCAHPAGCLRQAVALRSALDSQSVKVSNHGGVRGCDAGQKILGRKRHLLVDTLGLILAVVVHPANLQDRDGARLVLGKLPQAFGWLRLIWVDGGYAGNAPARWLKALLPRRRLRLAVVKRTALHTFKVLPRRWVVEKTFGWLSNYRRFAKDYEFRTDNSEAMILTAATRLMLRRLV